MTNVGTRTHATDEPQKALVNPAFTMREPSIWGLEGGGGKGPNPSRIRSVAGHLRRDRALSSLPFGRGNLSPRPKEMSMEVELERLASDLERVRKSQLRSLIKDVDKAVEAMSLANGVGVSREMLIRKMLADFRFAKAAVAIQTADEEVIKVLEKFFGPKEAQ